MTTTSRTTEYDADAARAEIAEAVAALERPSFRHRGRIYRGRILSFEQFRRFELRLLDWAAQKLSSRQVSALAYEYVAAVFPHPVWKIWERSVAWQVMTLPEKMRADAIARFLELQRVANDLWLGGTDPTSGSASPPAAAGERPA